MKWNELIVTDRDGNNLGSLGEIVTNSPQMLKHATFDGSALTWPDYFLSVDGEEPDWDTPRAPVDWTGFEIEITEE